jgi:hypothetical protein
VKAILRCKAPLMNPDWLDRRDVIRRLANDSKTGRLSWDDESGTHCVVGCDWGVRHVVATGPRNERDETLIKFSNRTDREYWQPIKMLFAWLGQAPIHGAHDWAKRSYKTAKREALTRGKEWDQALPRDIVEWANSIINVESKDDSCVDNTRVARVGNTGQMRRYRSQQRGGCCGFTDFERVGPDGKRYLLGWNHGH